MRSTTLAALLTLLTFGTAFGQTTTTQHAYGLDPYDPLDAQILREFGSVLVAQTPLSELRKLDPYNPTQAALLRSLGGGIPLWAPWYLPGPIPASLTPFESPSAATPAARGAAPPVDQAPAAASTDLAGGVETLRRAESNDGIWIAYAGRRWISSGAAVQFDQSAFTRVGDYSGFPVYRARSGGEDVIYVPTRQDLVAPYRLKR